MTEQVQTLPASIQTLRAVELFDGDADAIERVLAEVEGAARSIVPDVSTDKGRKSIASVAAKVARSKTFLDGLGKDHVAELKRRAGEVDAKRRVIRERLDTLKAEVRQPLTDFEQREADRQAAIRARIDALGAMPPDDPFTDSATLQARIAELEAVEIGDDFDEFREEAARVKHATLYELGRRLERVREREAAEAAAEAEIARQAAEQARRETEAAAAAERERAERAVAESQARAERDAAEARARAERAEQEAQQAAQRERQRLEAEQARERADAERRAADRAHRERIHREVLADLCDLGFSEGAARSLIEMIARGRVAHLSITY